MATVQNTGTGAVFFDQVISSTSSDVLITAQIDPSQPQVQGLTPVTNPLVTDRHLSARSTAFDPEQFDLSATSHLTRLLTALVAGSGVGGLRRQQIMARLSSVLAGTNFTELDGFWGKLFSLTRAPQEALPLNGDGIPLDPGRDVADSVAWDTATARDGSYRSRIEQLANGFALGATYDGLRTAAEAVLNCEVEVVEGWTYADFATPGSPGYTSNTWQVVSSQYGTWGKLQGVNWGTLTGGAESPTDSPLGNRGEVIVIPGRDVSESERMQLHNVLHSLAPATTVVTVAAQAFVSQSDVAMRSVDADSVDWDVVSAIETKQGIETGGVDPYPGGTDYESARPAFGRYSGERWSYNGRVASVTSYALDADGNRLPQVDYQTVVFGDGTSRDYVPIEAFVDSRQLALSRATAEGVLTSFPYASGRTG